MAKNDKQRLEDVSEVISRLDWLDEERLKTSRRLNEFEQRLAKQQTTIENRDQRIIELESQLTKVNSQLVKLSNFDIDLEQFKDEIVLLIEQYDQRRVKSQEELEKLRRIEHEGHLRDLAEIRKSTTPVSRLEEDMTLRQAEEVRLANLIGVLQGKVSNFQNSTETWSQELSFIEDSTRSNSRLTAELNASLAALSKKIDSSHARIDVNSHGLTKVQNTISDFADSVHELQDRIQNWTEQVQVGEYERNQRLKKWEERWQQAEDRLSQFTTDWVQFSDQYQEAKMAVARIEDWRTQLELQQKESHELIRVEVNRMQSRWDEFVLEVEQGQNNFEVENEQKWAGASRREIEIKNQLERVAEEIRQLTQEKDRLWRVQTAQSEALRKLPLMWLEEVEKAKDHDPNSRRSPTLIPVREE